jgi:hypothetical protein
LITNILGQVVLSYDKSLTGELQLDVSGLKKGIYIVSLYDKDGNIFSKKMAKD